MTLTRLLTLSKILCLLAVVAILIQLTLTIRHLEQQTTSSLERTTESVELLRQHADRVLTEAGLTAMEARKASAEQRVALQQISHQVLGVLGETEATIASLRSTSQGMAGDVHEVTAATVTALNGLPPVLDETKQTLLATQHVIADPNIPATLVNTNKAMASVAVSTANLAQTTARIDKKVEQMTAPVRWWKSVVTTLLGWGANAATIVK